MLKLSFRLAILGLFVASCVPTAVTPPDDQPEHPLLDNLEPPPLNLPVEFEPAEIEPVKPELPEDDSAGLILLLGDDPLVGVFSASGRLQVTEELIELEPSEGEALRILYRLPTDMVGLLERSGRGSADVTEFSGPQGADRLTIVMDERALLFAEVWRTSKQPHKIELAQGLTLAQEPVGAEDRQKGYTEVELLVFDGDGNVTPIPVGEPTILKTKVGEYQILAEVSHLLITEDSELDQFGSGYILHVWVVRVE